MLTREEILQEKVSDASLVNEELVAMLQKHDQYIWILI